MSDKIIRTKAVKKHSIFIHFKGHIVQKYMYFHYFLTSWTPS